MHGILKLIFGFAIALFGFGFVGQTRHRPRHTHHESLRDRLFGFGLRGVRIGLGIFGGLVIFIGHYQISSALGVDFSYSSILSLPHISRPKWANIGAIIQMLEFSGWQ